MTILEALDGVGAELRTRVMKRIIGTMRADIEAGNPLWRTFENAQLFSPNVISLIRIGEESGRLSENLAIVSEQERKERVFRSRIRSAMMYPLFVLGLTAVVGIGIAWFILPRLATVFAQLDVELPLITMWLIAAGNFLGEYGAIAIPLTVLGLSTALYVIFFAPRTKHIGQSLLFSIPAIRQLILETELSRFGYLLGTLLGAGLSIVQALASLRDATDFPRYRRFYEYLEKRIEDGDSFERAFKGYRRLDRLFPMPVQQLIVSGERSGKLASVLRAVSDRYEERSETTTKDLTVILEPILLVIVWLGVVAVALAVILPIYSLIGGLDVQ